MAFVGLSFQQSVEGQLPRGEIEGELDDTPHRTNSSRTVRSMRMLAHQSGWDEIAMVAVPLLLVIVLLLVANHRAARELAGLEADDTDDQP